LCFAQDLPPKIIQDIYCDISDLQRALYEDFSNAALKGDVETTVRELAQKVWPDVDLPSHRYYASVTQTKCTEVPHG
jgi:TATA-binding protein-associated factor